MGAGGVAQARRANALGLARDGGGENLVTPGNQGVLRGWGSAFQGKLRESGSSVSQLLRLRLICLEGEGMRALVSWRVLTACLPPPPSPPLPSFLSVSDREESPLALAIRCQRLATKLLFARVNRGPQGTRLRSGTHSGPDNGFLQMVAAPSLRVRSASGQKNPHPSSPPNTRLRPESFDCAGVLLPRTRADVGNSTFCLK